ncbi:MAG: response regulator transcription factor [Saprospiraceae bacterium]|nr:response regulator transcription factor [Saprospiraceae bacterium]MDW8483209.1 response regulator transcription factor [Saprospiraceae bacterium]
MIRIFIADDHAMFVEGLESLLNSEPDFEVCGHARNGREALQRVPEAKPDVLLLDINMPDCSGLEICKQLREQCPTVKILALSMHNDESYITAMLSHGAQGYVLKSTDRAELCHAIRTLAGGKTYFSKEVTDTVMQGLMRDRKSGTPKEPPKISRREREVLKLIVDERTTQEIAAQLFLSEKTVESHRAALLAKLGARNTAGLVKAAIYWKLLDD